MRETLIHKNEISSRGTPLQASPVLPSPSGEGGASIAPMGPPGERSSSGERRSDGARELSRLRGSETQRNPRRRDEGRNRPLRSNNSVLAFPLRGRCREHRERRMRCSPPQRALLPFFRLRAGRRDGGHLISLVDLRSPRQLPLKGKPRCFFKSKRPEEPRSGDEPSPSGEGGRGRKAEVG